MTDFVYQKCTQCGCPVSGDLEFCPYVFIDDEYDERCNCCDECRSKCLNVLGKSKD